MAWGSMSGCSCEFQVPFRICQKATPENITPMRVLSGFLRKMELRQRVKRLWFSLIEAPSVASLVQHSCLIWCVTPLLSVTVLLAHTFITLPFRVFLLTTEMRLHVDRCFSV